jgi:2',3'-cyclic-nucleotide 2'-phosphodiesterase (5'-nucleotidase family)
MKEEARRRGVDLLVVDSGDRVDGNGFVDGEPASQVKGYSAMKFFQQMPYDIITTGNHELYNYTVSLSTYRNLVAHYSPRYVTSNVNITLPPNEGGIERTVPLGSRFRKFITEQGRSVTAFGPIFDFKGILPSETEINLWWSDLI